MADWALARKGRPAMMCGFQSGTCGSSARVYCRNGWNTATASASSSSSRAPGTSAGRDVGPMGSGPELVRARQRVARAAAPGPTRAPTARRRSRPPTASGERPTTSTRECGSEPPSSRVDSGSGRGRAVLRVWGSGGDRHRPAVQRAPEGGLRRGLAAAADYNYGVTRVRRMGDGRTGVRAPSRTRPANARSPLSDRPVGARRSRAREPDAASTSGGGGIRTLERPYDR